jgi:L-2-hydroxyglutarate oxidase LhgO
MHSYDVAVVGAGIVGLAVAREVMLRRPGCALVVIDKQPAVGEYQTGHNSGVIHAGVYYSPGSLKARLCVEGAALMYEYCDANAITYERCGKLIVAIRQDELGRLADLQARGHANRVPGLRRLSGAEIAEIEPGCRGIAALHSPATGIVDFRAVARAIERELRGQGVTFDFGREVTSVRREPNATVLTHAAGRWRAGWVIVCAGLWSDRLAVSAGAPADPRVVPFRGEYLKLPVATQELVRGLVYPVPDPALPFLGVHVTRHVDGHVLLGPTALLALARDGQSGGGWQTLRDARQTLAWPGTWRMGRKFWRTGIDEITMAINRKAFVDRCAHYVPAVRSAVIEDGVLRGVRAQAVGRDGRLSDDFVIAHTPGATHVRNAPSPAATSSFALAREIVDRFDEASATGS